ncbi:MAG: hypothetical protein FJ100_18430 [Deltaproteobacteria bacterium]|nr:hypothetical protein [Deltaproteobacteria bacterium]
MVTLVALKLRMWVGIFSVVRAAAVEAGLDEVRAVVFERGVRCDEVAAPAEVEGLESAPMCQRRTCVGT